MPWRETDDPYRIWISEVMLQQTRVDQAEPYYRRFVERFPSVENLAEAPLDDVLLCWEGLGYYSRARHLHQAARKVVEDFDGQIPDAEDEIRALPGVGPYTAAAVLSIAYDRPKAVLDGNVIRVLTRVFRVDEEARRAATRRKLSDVAQALLQPDRPGDYNQALMELGATVCTPRAPNCPSCPLRVVCGAADAGDPEAYPVTAKRAPIPHHNVAVGVLFDDAGNVLIQKRPENGMLGGLWEFPGGKQEPDETVPEACTRELREELGVDVVVGEAFHEMSHAYSHFRITLHAFLARLPSGSRISTARPTRWVAPSTLHEYAFPRANRKLIDRLEREFGADFAVEHLEFRRHTS